MMRFPDIRRLMLIGDSVFAVSITLLAHAVNVPDRLTIDSLASPEMGRFFSDVGGVVLSVVVASLFWLGHWRYMRQVRSASVPLILAHFVFLLGLILLPISTNLYVANPDSLVATQIYGINLLYQAFAALFFRRQAVLNMPHTKPVLLHHAAQFVLIAIFSLSLLVSFRSAQFAQALWYVGLCSPTLELWINRRLRAQGAWPTA